MHQYSRASESPSVQTESCSVLRLTVFPVFYSPSPPPLCVTSVFPIGSPICWGVDVLTVLLMPTSTLH